MKKLQILTLIATMAINVNIFAMDGKDKDSSSRQANTSSSVLGKHPRTEDSLDEKESHEKQAEKKQRIEHRTIKVLVPQRPAEQLDIDQDGAEIFTTESFGNLINSSRNQYIIARVTSLNTNEERFYNNYYDAHQLNQCLFGKYPIWVNANSKNLEINGKKCIDPTNRQQINKIQYYILDKEVYAKNANTPFEYLCSHEEYLKFVDSQNLQQCIEGKKTRLLFYKNFAENASTDKEFEQVLNAGNRWYDNKDYKNALMFFNFAYNQKCDLAIRAKSAFWIGGMHKDGEGAEQDFKTAIQYLEFSFNNLEDNKQLKARAANKLGCMYRDVIKDYNKARDFFDVARSIIENPDAQAWATRYLAALYKDGLGVQKDYIKALELFHQAKSIFYEGNRELVAECDRQINVISRGVNLDLAINARKTKKFAEAYECLQEAIKEQYINQSTKEEIAREFEKLGGVYFDGKDVAQDLSLTAKCWAMAFKYGNSETTEIAKKNLNLVTNEYRNRADKAYSAGNFNLAYECYVVALSGNVDQRAKEEISKKLFDLGFKYGQMNFFEAQCCARVAQFGSSRAKVHANFRLAQIAAAAKQPDRARSFYQLVLDEEECSDAIRLAVQSNLLALQLQASHSSQLDQNSSSSSMPSSSSSSTLSAQTSTSSSSSSSSK